MCAKATPEAERTYTRGMSVTRVVRAQVPALLLALSGLAACGSEGSPGTGQAADAPTTDTATTDTATADTATAEPEGEQVPAGTPRCASVWRDGARIPRDYQGCVEDGDLVERDVLGCSSGQRLVRHADRFYGVLGGPVQEVAGPLDSSREYTAVVRACRG